MNGIAPENWLSHGTSEPMGSSEEIGQDGSESNLLSPNQDSDEESKTVDENVTQSPMNAVNDPYLQISSHWMAPGKNFSKQRGIDNDAKRTHLIRIETMRASVESEQIDRESEFIVSEPAAPLDSPFKAL